MSSSALHLNMVVPPAPWTQALQDGQVSIPGVTWTCNSDVEHAPQRFIVSETQDVGENGVRRLALAHLKSAPPVALPVFFGRELMQRNVLVRRDSRLREAGDLVGQRVGSHLSVESGTGGAVLMMLEQAYGVPLNQVEWRMGRPDVPAANPMGLRRAQGPRNDDEAIAWLLRGDLDAVITTSGPRYFSLFGRDRIDDIVRAHPEIRPLIEDPQVIAAAYRRTQLYPITDVVVMRPEVTTQHPDLPGRLVEVFSEGNRLASNYRDADEEALAQREVELLGADPHRYELGAEQRHNLQTWIDFLHRLGSLERSFESSELFCVR